MTEAVEVASVHGLRMRPFSGTPIDPSELLELAEFATPRVLSDAHRSYEAENLAQWCDVDPTLARHAALLARGRRCRPEVVAVLDEVARIEGHETTIAATA